MTATTQERARLDPARLARIDAVPIDVARSMIPGSVGEDYRGGMFSTAFFADPVARLHRGFTTQMNPVSTDPLRRELKTTIYSAVL